MGDDIIDTLKDFYYEMGKVFKVLIENPFLVLLVVGFLLLIGSFMLMINRHNYTRIVKMIDKGEEDSIKNRVEEWGEMIVNNVQQECMERKLKLTVYILILPLLSIAIIAFSIYKLDILTTILVAVIHLVIILIIFYIIKKNIKGKNTKEKQVKLKESIEKEER